MDQIANLTGLKCMLKRKKTNTDMEKMHILTSCIQMLFYSYGNMTCEDRSRQDDAPPCDHIHRLAIA